MLPQNAQKKCCNLKASLMLEINPMWNKNISFNFVMIFDVPYRWLKMIAIQFGSREDFCQIFRSRNPVKCEELWENMLKKYLKLNLKFFCCLLNFWVELLLHLAGQLVSGSRQTGRRKMSQDKESRSLFEKKSFLFSFSVLLSPVFWVSLPGQKPKVCFHLWFSSHFKVRKMLIRHTITL